MDEWMELSTLSTASAIIDKYCNRAHATRQLLGVLVVVWPWQRHRDKPGCQLIWRSSSRISVLWERV